MQGVLEKEEIVPENMLNKVKAGTQSINPKKKNKRKPRLSRERNQGLQVREIVINTKSLTKWSWN